MDIKELVNRGIDDLSPYEPGKPIEDLERDLGIENAIKLASNENPMGPSPKIFDSIEAVLKETHRYPDGNATRLKSTIARKFNVEDNQVTIGNGSNDIIEFVARIFLSHNDSAIYSEHAFAVYPLVVKAVGAKGIEVPAKNFSHDLDLMFESIEENTKLIFIANPNNPTGSFIEYDQLIEFLKKVPEHIIVLLDQAYFDYSSFETKDIDFDVLSRFPNLIMSRSFSKAYGLAGFRVGFCVSSTEIADYLNRVRQPFNANSLALFAAEKALEDQDFIDKCLQLNLEQKELLYKELNSLGFDCLPSRGNFISFDCKQDSREAFNKLLKEGVIVRSLAVYKMQNYLRVSVGLPEENLSFLEKIKSTLL